MLAAVSLLGATGCASSKPAAVLCNATGAPPIQTVAPVTTRPACTDGRVLSFDQNGVERYACLNLPPQASSGRSLFELHRTYDLSADPDAV